MTLHQLYEKFINSNDYDWNYISDGSQHIISKTDTGYNGASDSIRILHPHLRCYKDDLSITFAAGFKLGELSSSKWPSDFYNSVRCYADIYYNGMLVFRNDYALVNGGRDILPVPNVNSEDQLIAPNEYCAFLKKLSEISGRRDFEKQLADLTIKVTDDYWLNA